MKYILAGITCFLILILTSCIFSPDKENFVEVDQDVTVPEIYNQTLDLDADTLYVWKYTRFSFDFKTSNQEIRSSVVVFGNDTLKFASGAGSFQVNPETFKEGTSELEIKLYAGSGTGSLADIVGVEGFEFMRTWVLVVEKVKPPVINISSTIENGFLKFSWNKMNQPYIRSFQMFIQNDGLLESYSHQFTNHNITNFVDSLYVGGKITFRLWVNYETSQGYETTAIKEYVYDYPISLSFKEDLERLTISWTRNPFRFTPYFETSGSGPILINADSTYILPAPGLGDARTYNIGFKPLKAASWPGRMSNHYAKYSLGVNNGLKHKNVEYNSSLNAYFFKDEMSIKSANKDLKSENSYNYPWDYADSYTLAFSNDKQKIYSTVNGSIVTVHTTGMALIDSRKNTFLPEPFSKALVLKSLNDQTLLIGYQLMGGYRFVLFNPATSSIINQSEKLTSDSMSSGNYLMDVSSDGRYAAYCCQKGLYLFEIVDHTQLTLRYHDANAYLSCLFDPQVPERLILNRRNDIQVFNCFTLQTEKTIDQIYANPINIDPKTHYMLLVSNSKKKLYVYDYENDVMKLEMNHHVSATDFKLLNNIIFVNAGYHFDISSYVD